MRWTVWMLAAMVCGQGASCASSEDAPLNEASEALVNSPSVDLVARGILDAHGGDLARRTSGPLENGVPGNSLGGMGSGIAYVGGNTFLALPDRGPNAVPWNATIDDTASYIPRFHTLSLNITPSQPGADLPLTVRVALQNTTLLWSLTPLAYGKGGADFGGVGSGAPALNDGLRHYFSGRSDNFDPARPSTFVGNGRLDPESIRTSADELRVYVSDEYGPYVYEFERFTGLRLRTFDLPSDFAVTKLSAKGDDEIANNTIGRVANKGMEGLALTPDGKTLVGAMQSPLLQDKGTSGRYTRIVEIDIRTGAVSQFVYALDNIGTDAKPKYPTISEIVALNNHEFLVDERDGKGLGDNSTAAFKRVFHIDLASASDASGIEGESALASYAVSKTLFIDIVKTLNAHGIASNDIPAKLEGLAFGPDVTVGGVRKHTLVLANDNDFLPTITDTNHPQGIENPNQFFVFAFTDADLPGLVRPSLLPSWLLPQGR